MRAIGVSNLYSRTWDALRAGQGANGFVTVPDGPGGSEVADGPEAHGAVGMRGGDRSRGAPYRADLAGGNGVPDGTGADLPPGATGADLPPGATGADRSPGATGDHSPGQHEVAGLFRERHAELVRLAALVVGDRATAE